MTNFHHTAVELIKKHNQEMESIQVVLRALHNSKLEILAIDEPTEQELALLSIIDSLVTSNHHRKHELFIRISYLQSLIK